MTPAKVLVSDDERVAFAIELGWSEPDDATSGNDVERAASAYFDRESLLASGYDAELDGVSQPLLDEVRDAVVRRRLTA